MSHVDPYWIWLIVKIGAIATAAGAIYKYIWCPLKLNVIDKLTSFYEKVDYITKELKPNGGNSLRDQVNYIKRTVEKIDQRQLNFFHFDPDGIIETDSRGNLVWANRAYLDLVKRHPEEVQLQGWRNVIAEADRERIIREWTSAVADSRDFFSTHSVVDSHGIFIKVEVRCLAMRDYEDKLIGHLGFVVRLDQPYKLGSRFRPELPRPNPSAIVDTTAPKAQGTQ